MLKHIARLTAFLLIFSLVWAQDESPLSEALRNFPAITFKEMARSAEIARLFLAAKGRDGTSLWEEENFDLPSEPQDILDIHDLHLSQIAENIPLCVSSELNGQKAYIAGGGYTQGRSWGNTYSVAADIDDYWHLVGPAQEGSSTLLIVDDFDTINPWHNTSLSHGELVFQHVMEALTGLSPTSVFHSDEQSEVTIDGHTLTVLQVRIDFSDATSVGRALAGVSLDGTVVINMSWGVIVCGLNNDFEASRERYPEHKYDSYLIEVAEVNKALCDVELDIINDIKALLNDPDNVEDNVERDCALLVLLAGNEFFSSKERVLDESEGQMDRNVTTVAAAGNLGLDFALVPASWEGVIAVCGGDIEKRVLADYSNREEVMAPGGVFELEIEDQIVEYAGTSFASPLVEYAGTSFASPLAALAQALTGAIPDMPPDASCSPTHVALP
jgi:hypothetical protein